jgi:AcrR family transcriptional regulator
MARKKGKLPPRTYPAHRERQRNRILDAAEKVFVERGIDRVTMAELTSASGVQPSTMYQYFSSKDDIVWAIVGNIMTKVSARTSEADASAESALDKITAFFEYMAEELSDQRARVRFMAQFDAMYSRDWPVERLLKLEAESSKTGRGVFRDLIRAGIADGSLRSDLDPNLTMQAIINAAIGTQRRLASLGNKVELEYGQSVDKLFRETIRVILLGLRATGPPESEPSKGAKARKVNPARKSK